MPLSHRTIVLRVALLLACMSGLVPARACAQRCERGEGPLRVQFEEEVLTPAQRAEVLHTLSLSLRVRHVSIEEGPREAGAAAVRVTALLDGRLGLQLACASDSTAHAREVLVFDPSSLDDEVVAFALARSIDEVLQDAQLVAAMDHVHPSVPPEAPSPEAESVEDESVEDESVPVSEEHEMVSEEQEESTAPAPPTPALRSGDEGAPDDGSVSHASSTAFSLRLALGPSVSVLSTGLYQLGGRLALSLRADRVVIAAEFSASTAPDLAAQHGTLTVSTFGGTLAFLGRALDAPDWHLDLGPVGSVAAVLLDATAGAGWSARDALVPTLALGGRVAVSDSFSGGFYVEATLDIEAVVVGIDARGEASIAHIDGVVFVLGILLGAEVS